MSPCANWSWSWTSVEALSSVLTASFTLGSLIYLARYTKTAIDGYKLASTAQQDSVRPVLVLIAVKPADTQTLAIFKNAGQGIAINVAQKMLDGTFKTLDSNAIAPDHTLSITLAHSTVPIILDIRYESLGGDKCCTVSTANEGDRIFNRYFPNAKDANAQIEEAGSFLVDQAEMADIKAKAIAIRNRLSQDSVP